MASFNETFLNRMMNNDGFILKNGSLKLLDDIRIKAGSRPPLHQIIVEEDGPILKVNERVAGIRKFYWESHLNSGMVKVIETVRWSSDQNVLLREAQWALR